MLSAVGERAQRWVASFDPFTNVYGIARTILATATAATLAINSVPTLFHPIPNVPEVPLCGGLRGAGAFCVANGHLEAMRWMCVALLLVVASGYRPRYTGIVHAWVAFSLQANAIQIEGGDQIASILTMLLVPVTLLDDRRWHWGKSAPRALSEREQMRRFVARACFGLIRLQVAGIYFHASVGKFKVEEWTDGTALYYWLNHPTFGAAPWIAPLVRPVLLNGALVALATWGVLVVEFALAAGLLASKPYRPTLLRLGLALHAGIAVLHGLVSFSTIMFAALILFLRPLDETFAMPAWAVHAYERALALSPRLSLAVKRAVRSARGGRAPVSG